MNASEDRQDGAPLDVGGARADGAHQATPRGEDSDQRRQDPAADADGASARDALLRVRTEVGKAIVGQDPAVTGMLIGLLADGHVLLEGVPGVAKTLLVRTLATALSLDTKRVQFTPDLMPGDITGSLIY